MLTIEIEKIFIIAGLAFSLLMLFLFVFISIVITIENRKLNKKRERKLNDTK